MCLYKKRYGGFHMKNCIKCNQKLEDNAIFCNSCGASQETENQIDRQIAKAGE